VETEVEKTRVVETEKEEKIKKRRRKWR